MLLAEEQAPSGHPSSMSPPACIERLWRLYLLETYSYAQLCAQLVPSGGGFFIHHTSLKPLPAGQPTRQRRAMQAYQKRFKSAAPAAVWGRSEASHDGSDAERAPRQHSLGPHNGLGQGRASSQQEHLTSGIISGTQRGSKQLNHGPNELPGAEQVSRQRNLSSGDVEGTEGAAGASKRPRLSPAAAPSPPASKTGVTVKQEEVPATPHQPSPLRPSNINVTVQDQNGASLYFAVSPGTLVGGIKDACATKYGIKSDSLILIYQGGRAYGGDNMRQLGVQDGDSFDMMVELCGC